MRLLPSVKDIGAALAQVLRRFFPVVVAALGATACVMIMLEYDDSSPAFTKALMACVLGVPWLFALSLIHERLLRDWRGMALVILGVILIVLYDFGLQVVPSSFPLRHVERFFLLLTGAHCLAAIAPFLAGASRLLSGSSTRLFPSIPAWCALCRGPLCRVVACAPQHGQASWPEI